MDDKKDDPPVYYCGEGFELSEAQIKWLNERIGDGVRCKDLYHSAGSPARSLKAIAEGEVQYWTKEIAGFELATEDSMTFEISEDLRNALKPGDPYIELVPEGEPDERGMIKLVPKKDPKG